MQLIKTMTYLSLASSLLLFSCSQRAVQGHASSDVQSKLNGFANATSKGLSREEAKALQIASDSIVRAQLTNELQSPWQDRKFTAGDKIMPFATETYGDKPADGRSLYISLHGGGNAPAEVNDGQWKNQIRMTSDQPKMYNIPEGVVIVPRAPVNDWNMWFQQEMDDLLKKSIQAAVLFADVNPNKVYIMGYSAGGDGVYRLASRMADYWAAASMSAGHPGEITPLNLNNIGFALNMGGRDTPFNRAGLAAEWKIQLDELAKEHPGQYIHQVNIFDDLPHWMNMQDKIAITFMANFVRNPYPNEIVWVQNAVHPHNRFYWIGISDEDTIKPGVADKEDQAIRIRKEGNHIQIIQNYADNLSIYLNDEVVNLDEEITISYQGTTLFKGKVNRKQSIIEETAKDRQDSAYIFSAKLTVLNNATVEVQ